MHIGVTDDILEFWNFCKIQETPAIRSERWIAIFEKLPVAKNITGVNRKHNIRTCQQCGNGWHETKSRCPALNVKCHCCKQTGHFPKMLKRKHVKIMKDTKLIKTTCYIV